MKAFSLFIVYALLCALSGLAFFVARAVQLAVPLARHYPPLLPQLFIDFMSMILYIQEADHTEEYLAWAVALTVANLRCVSPATLAR
jgi:hypothetical protein